VRSSASRAFEVEADVWLGGDVFCEHTGPDCNGFCITCCASYHPDPPDEEDDSA
jgi:hypothetical protein